MIQTQSQEMQSSVAPPSCPAAPPRRPPSLEAGDHLTPHEFERRYAAFPDLKKAELIEGVVSMPAPMRFNQHGSPHADVMAWLGVYRAGTPGVRVGDNSSIRLDLHNEPQPNVVMIVEPSCGGLAWIDEEGYLAGGPELVAEVAASTVNIARNSKMRIYRRNNVREYIIWREEDAAIDWFVLREGE
jgi:hypothetical protein